jgi:hypothetical protein
VMALCVSGYTECILFPTNADSSPFTENLLKPLKIEFLPEYYKIERRTYRILPLLDYSKL